MKTCPSCSSVTFDDMEMCYDCMTPFANTAEEDNTKNAQAAARLQVVLADYFCYELLLQKLEGRSLSIGSAAENAIVIPQEQVASHQLDIFYAQGHLWAEGVDTTSQATVGDIPLCGTVRIQPGTEINVGDAKITFLEA
jgi:UDP-3-O-acyl-N-acetylglucosamine deacetylase